METIFSWTVLCLQVVIICALTYGAREYIRFKRLVRIFIRTMECEDLLEHLLEEGPKPMEKPEPSAEVGLSKKRARLAALAAGGQAKLSFKGWPVSVERVDTMSDAEIEEMPARYEAQLGAAMSKSLGSSLLRLYASAASMLLPLPPESQTALVADLEDDPFVSSALSGACCELYYRYGMYLAPLTTVLTTAKHCDWGYHIKASVPLKTDDGVGAGDTERNVPNTDGES